MEPRATLGLSSLHPGARLGLSLFCIYIYIYHMIQKHRVIFIFLHRERVVSVLSIVLPSLFFAFLPRTRQESCLGACDHHHHYARAFLLSFSTSSSSSSPLLHVLDECTSPRCTCVRPSSSPSSSSTNENYAFAVATISEIRTCIRV